MSSFKTTLGRTEVPVFQRWTGCGSVGPGPGHYNTPRSSLGESKLAGIGLKSTTPRRLPSSFGNENADPNWETVNSSATMSARKPPVPSRRHTLSASILPMKEEDSVEKSSPAPSPVALRTRSKRSATPRGATPGSSMKPKSSSHKLERDLKEARKRLSDAEKVLSDSKHEAEREARKLSKEKQSWRAKALEARSEAEKANAERRRLQQQVDQLLRAKKETDVGRENRGRTPGKRREARTLRSAARTSLELVAGSAHDSMSTPATKVDEEKIGAFPRNLEFRLSDQDTEHEPAKRLEELEALLNAQKVDTESFQSEARAAQLEIVAKNVEIAGLQESIQEMERCLADKESDAARLTALEEENEALRRSSEVSSSKVEEGSPDALAVIEQVESLQLLVAERDSECAALSQRLEEAVTAVKEMETQLDSYPDELERIREKALQEKEMYETATTELRKELLSASTERDHAKAELMQRKTDSGVQLDNLHAIKAILEDDVDALQQELKHVIMHTVSLEQCVDSADARGDDLERAFLDATTTIDDLRVQLESLRVVDTESTAQIKMLAAEKESLMRLVTSMSESFEEARAINDDLSMENMYLAGEDHATWEVVHCLGELTTTTSEKLESADKRMMGLLFVGNKSLQELEEMSNEIAGAKENHALQLKEKSKELVAARDHALSLEQEVSQKSEQLTTLEQLSFQMTVEAENAATGSTELVGRCGELEDSLRSRDEQLDSLQGSISEKDETIASLVEQVERLLEKNQGLTEAVSSSKSHMHALEEQVRRGQGELSAAVDISQTSQKECEKLRSELEERRRDHEMLEAQVKARESAKREEAAVVEELRTTLSEKEEAIKFMGEQVEGLLEKNQELTEAVASSKDHMNALEEQLRGGQLELSAAVGSSQTSQKECEKLRSELEERRRDHEMLEAQVKARESAKSEEAVMVEELRTTLSEKEEAIKFMGEQVTELLQKQEEAQQLQLEAKTSILAFLEAKAEAEGLLKAQDEEITAIRADLSNLKRGGSEVAIDKDALCSLQKQKDTQLEMLRAEIEKRKALEGEIISVNKLRLSADREKKRLEDQVLSGKEATSKLHSDMEFLEQQKYAMESSMEELREALATSEAARDDALSAQRAAKQVADDVGAKLAWMENHTSMNDEDLARMQRDLDSERESRLRSEAIVDEAQQTAQSAAYVAAELAGHHNPKQRIKYVHTLREQIFHLQKNNRMLERRLAELSDEDGPDLALLDRLMMRSIRKFGKMSAVRQGRRATSESPSREIL